MKIPLGPRKVASLVHLALTTALPSVSARTISDYADTGGMLDSITVNGTTWNAGELIGGSVTGLEDPNAAQLMVGKGGDVPAVGGRAALAEDRRIDRAILNVASFTFGFATPVKNNPGIDLVVLDWGGFGDDTFSVTINGQTFDNLTNSDASMPPGADFYSKGSSLGSDWFASTSSSGISSVAELEALTFSTTRTGSTAFKQGVVGLDLDAFGVATGASVTELTISGGSGSVDPSVIRGLPDPPAIVGPVVAFYQFDDDPGFLIDSEGNHNLAAGAGTVTQVPTTPADGKAADLDGSGSLASPDAADWTDDSFTIEAFVIPNSDFSSGSTGVIAGHIEATGDQRSWFFGIRDGALRLLLSEDGAGGSSYDHFTLSAGTPYFCAASVNTSTQQAVLYLEDLDTNQSWRETVPLNEASVFDAAANFTIGATDTPGSFFDGIIDDVRVSSVALAGAGLLRPQSDESPVSNKGDGYKGIWFDLGQGSAYGSKYSGGLGTYTAKHVPLSIHAPAVDKTFFVYGGTTAPDEKRLLIMASEYDHATHTVPKPTIVLDKTAELGSTVNDPHDNPALAIDNSGYLWIFVSGRSGNRQDWTFKSTAPYSADAFALVEPPGGDKRGYPQIFHIPGSGFMHLFTIYQPGRELFVRTSADGLTWSPNIHLADMQGHYQVSWRVGNKVGTMFNRHPGAKVDERTDLFYLQTTDFGATWTTVDGTPVSLPITSETSPCGVFDYSGANKLVYLNDLNFDADGNPVLFYTTVSNADGGAHQPGPFAEPRKWVISHWNGSQWNHHEMPASATSTSTVTHNYDTGCIHIEGDLWRVVGPTGAPSIDPAANPKRFWGQGGEIQVWESTDQGTSWTRVHETTRNSPRNHGYARRTWAAADRFATFWADGNPDTFTESHLYFSNKEGTRYWELPYDMTTATATPVEVDPPYQRWLELHFSPAEIAAGTITDPDDDPDEDGRSNLREYDDGSDPRADDAGVSIRIEMQDHLGETYPELRVESYRFAYDLGRAIEISDDLEGWSDAGADLEEAGLVEAGDRKIETFRDVAASQSTGTHPRRFYRKTLQLKE